MGRPPRNQGVAQSVEYRLWKPGAAGSSPAALTRLNERRWTPWPTRAFSLRALAKLLAGGGQRVNREACAGLCLWARAQARPARRDRHASRTISTPAPKRSSPTCSTRRARCDPLFVAKAALYARSRGAMKDMPALLAAWLTVADPDLAVRVFGRVIDNGRMLRNFVQIMRSGAVGRTSLGTRPKRLVQLWLEQASMRGADAGGDRQGSVAGRHRPDGPPEAGRRGAARPSMAG